MELIFERVTKTNLHRNVTNTSYLESSIFLANDNRKIHIEFFKTMLSVYLH